MRFVEGFGVAQIQFGGLQVVLVIQARHFIQHLNIHALIRLQTDRQLVLRQLLPGLFKQVQLRVLEIDHNFRAFGRQTFTGAQIERHSRPAPVVDIDTDRHESLGIAGLVRALFFQIARDFFALRETGGVLTADGFLTHIRAIDTAQRFQHFHFLVANVIR
ncbi:hypothetical protein D3C72_946930 [compost metagenome]